MLEEIRELLKIKRKKSKLSQQALANKIEIAQTHYSDIERGRCEPSLKVMSKLAAILDIDMNLLKLSYKND